MWVNCIRLNHGRVRQRDFVISVINVQVLLLTFLNEIHSIKLMHQLAYFTTHYNMVIGKGQLHRRTGHEGPEVGEEACLTSALDAGGYSTPGPSCFIPREETRYPMHRKLSVPQGQYGRARKISSSPGFDSLTVQPVAGRYTDWAIPTTNTVIGSKHVSLTFIYLSTLPQCSTFYILKHKTEIG